MIFEEMMEYFELLKNQRNYMINEFNFGNGVLVIQKDNGREEKIRLGKEMMFEYAKTLIDKYAKKSKRLFLLDKKFVAVPIPFDEETALKVYLVD